MDYSGEMQVPVADYPRANGGVKGAMRVYHRRQQVERPERL